MPTNMTLEEIGKLNPGLDIRQLEEWRELRQTIVNNGVAGRTRRIQSPRREARAQFDDSGQHDSRMVRLNRK